MYELGRARTDSAALEPERDQATRWLHRAAEAGHARAMLDLGNADRISGRRTEAVAWYEQAANCGLPAGRVRRRPA